MSASGDAFLLGAINGLITTIILFVIGFIRQRRKDNHKEWHDISKDDKTN